MSPERPYPVDDIVQAIREHRIGADAALAWVELRADEAARESRRVMAHATPALRNRAHKALDAALDGGGTDEFSHLFPPERPLGPPLAHEEYPSQSLVYDGGQQGQRSRQPRTAASAGDDEDYDDAFPPEYRAWARWGSD
jgi:hypothetical protein